MLDAARLFTWAWKVVPRLPTPVVRAVFDLVALGAHAANIGGVRQLRANLHRVTGAKGRMLRKLSRQGMRRYMRYYAEVFQLPRMTPEQISARVRTVNGGPVRRAVKNGTVVAGLGHLGNWDLAGAWSEAHLAHVITVAEKLEPEELFTQFLDFRQGLGMTIFAFEKGTGLFKNLVHAASTENAMMPLLVDRDLTRDGIVVQVCGHPMRVAPGPAAVSVAAQVPFVGAFIRHERLRGGRRKQAGSPWGIVIEFTNIIQPPPHAAGNATEQMMQSWADEFSAFVRTYPQDWHMLQKCFVADLDEDRLAQAASGVYGEAR